MSHPFEHTDRALHGKTILAIFTSSADRRVIYKRLATDLNVRIIMVSTEVKDWADPFVAKWVIIQSVRIDLLVHDVLTSISDESIDGVVSFDEYGIYPCAHLAEKLGKAITPLPARDVMHTQDKALFRQWCHRVGLNSPREFQLQSIDELSAFTAKLSKPASDSQRFCFPLIVKPSPGAGSSYVTKCETIDELCKCASHAFASLQPYYAFLADKSAHADTSMQFVPPSILVEEYIEGDEVDIDCVVSNGKILYMCISDNFPSRTLPFFVESGGLAPSALSDTKLDALRALVQSYASCAGPKLNGVLHFEAKYDTINERAVVIEANLRLGAAETFHLNVNTTGVDIAVEYVKMAVGIEPMVASSKQLCETPPVSTPSVTISVPGITLSSRYFASVNFPPVRCRLFRRAAHGTVETKLPSDCPQNHTKSYVLQTQTVPDELLADPHYVSHRLYFSEGYHIQPLCVNTRALGWLLCWGSTPEEAKGQLDRLAAKVVFEAVEA